MEIPVRTREQVEDAVCKGLVDYRVENFKNSTRITLNTLLGELVSDSLEYTEACISIEERLGLERNFIDALYNGDNTLNKIYLHREKFFVRDLAAFYYNGIEDLRLTN